MGAIFSKKRKCHPKSEGVAGSHVAKQNVTLWTYANNGNTLVPTQISKGDLVQVKIIERTSLNSILLNSELLICESFI